MWIKKRIIVLLSVLAISLFGILEYLGVIWHTELLTRSYPIKGLDVSNHQHTIDWEKVSNSDYKFVFIKATEGKNFIDKSFKVNWKGAKDNGFLVGAYHFFVTTSTGEQQALNFINTVPIEENSLPAVIDLEVSIKENVKTVRDNLKIMIDMIAKTYKKEPILYVTYETYTMFIKGYFKKNNIWIRDIIKMPKLEYGREWTFWQYCNRGRIKGIDTYVDINVFKGNERELLD